MLRVDAARSAIAAAAGHVFFNGKLEPVQPAPGQWFCEFMVPEVGDELEAGAIVEYLGADDGVVVGPGGVTSPAYPAWRAHRVAEEGDGDRLFDGDILILQH